MTDGTDGGNSGNDGGSNATSELLNAISQDIRQLVRDELQRARTELGGSIQSGRRAAFLFGAAAMFGAVSAGTSATVIVRILDTALPRPVAGMVATGVFGAAAAGFGWLGVSEVRRVRDQLTAG